MDASLSVAEKRLLLALRDSGAQWVLAEALVHQVGVPSMSQVEHVAGDAARKGLVESKQEWREVVSWTPEGRDYKQNHLPERRLAHALALNGGRLSLRDIEARFPAEVVKVALAWGMRKKWFRMADEAGEKGLSLVAGEPPVGDDEQALSGLRDDLESIPDTPGGRLLASRKSMFAPRELRTPFLRLTPAGLAAASDLRHGDLAGATEVNQLTPEFIAKWPTLSPAERAKHVLRPFDFGVPVAVPSPGKAHPLTHIIQEIRDIFVALGFSEIAGDYVEPAFWNMDALFIPQDHPARDMQDTFYLKSPATAPVPDKLFATVKGVHQSGGGTGSTGWGGSFDKATAQRTLLRTHTTVTTIRHLAAHPTPPTRVFGIGRVFRNEAMDATHLPEFHQVEGIIVEEGATLSMLMGVLREFYKRMGFPQVKFRPSFYPYTEPSLDVAVKWNDKWLELGGAGVFRPEVTKPLGVPTNVLAWGLGLERLAMLRLGLKDIRQLYLSDVEWLRTSPLR